MTAAASLLVEPLEVTLVVMHLLVAATLRGRLLLLNEDGMRIECKSLEDMYIVVDAQIDLDTNFTITCQGYYGTCLLCE